jgi:hypothetical protein
MTLVLNGTTGVSAVDGSASTPAIQGSDTNTGIFFPAADTIAFAEGGTEVMRIDSSGNVGIGTTSPGYKLAVVGRVSYSGAIGEGADTTLSSTGTTIRLAESSTWQIVSFYTAGTERARITSGGDMLVGTTSSSGKLSVDGGTGMSSSGVIARFLGTSGNSLIVRGSGNCENTNGAYGAISDAKLKENVTDATPKLEKLNQVRIVNFNLIGSEQKQIGVIAQELEQIFPGMVEETADTDSEGNDLGTTTKSVKYSVFVPMLIKAIQEQQTLITSLTARIAALEGAAS